MTEKRKSPPAKAPAPEDTQPTEEQLDEAIEDSMDASDPPSYVTKGTPSRPPRSTDDVSPEAGRDKRRKS
jgi:hypothetical protein